MAALVATGVEHTVGGLAQTNHALSLLEGLFEVGEERGQMVHDVPIDHFHRCHPPFRQS